MTPSNTAWAREAALVWLGEYPLFGFTTAEAIPIVAELLLAVERKAKEEAAVVAQDDAWLHAAEHDNPTVAHNAAMNIRDNIRSTLPPTSKTE